MRSTSTSFALICAMLAVFASAGRAQRIQTPGGSSSGSPSYPLTTTLGNPGLDTNAVSEKAIRSALTALLSGLSTVAISGSYADLLSKPSTFAPSAHASTHGTAGADAVSLDASQIATGVFNAARIPAQTWASITGKPTFATVATSGSFLDLSNTPTIPTAGSATPIINGTGAAGVATPYSRQDHVHPTDTSRQAALGYTAENVANKNVANGYVGMDSSGRISPVDGSQLTNIPGSALSLTTSTSGPVTVTTAGYYFNNSTGALTYNLPTITSGTIGSPYCFYNDATRSGAITITAPASTVITYNGVNTAAAGSVVSTAALGDSGCVVAKTTTQYVFSPGIGVWN